MPSPLRRAVDGAVFAITFLTIVPLPTRGGRGAEHAPAWFGAVGALIGGLGAAVHAAAEPVFGASVAAALAVSGMVVVTGGLHQDGLADCADGIGVRGGIDRRLAVMREPSVGTYGVLALLLWGLLVTTSVASMTPRDAAWALVCSASAGRFAALLHARWAPAARRDGLGAAFDPSLPALLAAGATATAFAVMADLGWAPAVLGTAGLSAAMISAWARRRLGGRTGDTLGATVVVTETLVVLVLLASASSVAP